MGSFLEFLYGREENATPHNFIFNGISEKSLYERDIVSQRNPEASEKSCLWPCAGHCYILSPYTAQVVLEAEDIGDVHEDEATVGFYQPPDNGGVRECLPHNFQRRWTLMSVREPCRHG